jgi:ABC-type phosphate transport system substrate-binding protein
MLHTKWHEIMSVVNRNRYQQNVLTSKILQDIFLTALVKEDERGGQGPTSITLLHWFAT